MIIHLKATTREAAIVEARSVLRSIVWERESKEGVRYFIGERQVVFHLHEDGKSFALFGDQITRREFSHILNNTKIIQP